MKYAAPVLFCIAAISGCAHHAVCAPDPPPPPIPTVTLEHAPKAGECLSVSQIEAGSSGPSARVRYKAAVRLLGVQAKAQGANLLVVGEPEDRGGIMKLIGDALRCGPAAH
jgi:hypothetical protein